MGVKRVAPPDKAKAVPAVGFKKITPKVSVFIDEYLLDLNATRAAGAAGYSMKTASRIGHALLQSPVIAAELDKRKAARQKRLEIKADYVLTQAVELHKRCMQEISPMKDRKGETVIDEDGRQVFQFNASGAAKALEIIGKHVSIQAFNEQSTINVKHTYEDMGREALRDIILGMAGKVAPKVIPH